LELLEIEADIAFSGEFETNPDETIVDLRYRIQSQKGTNFKVEKLLSGF